MTNKTFRWFAIMAGSRFFQELANMTTVAIYVEIRFNRTFSRLAETFWGHCKNGITYHLQLEDGICLFLS